jgi:hypothetical protein
VIASREPRPQILHGSGSWPTAPEGEQGGWFERAKPDLIDHKKGSIEPSTPPPDPVYARKAATARSSDRRKGGGDEIVRIAGTIGVLAALWLAIGAFSASAAAVVKTIKVGEDPESVSFDGTHVWVANDGGTVSEIGASTGRVVETIKIGGNPESVSSDGTRVWVTNGDATVSEIDASTGTVVNTITIDNGVQDFSTGAGGPVFTRRPQARSAAQTPRFDRLGSRRLLWCRHAERRLVEKATRESATR